MIAQSVRSQETKNVNSETRQQLKARTREVLTHEIGFMSNPCFREFDVDKLWRKELAVSEPLLEAPVQTGRSPLPAHLERMCSMFTTKSTTLKPRLVKQ